MYCLRHPSARRHFLSLATARRSFVTSARHHSDTSGAAPPPPPPLIYPAPSTTRHHDLASFQSYAVRTNLDPTSTVYVGTLYEYAVGAALAPYGFHLRRVGGARDRGADLLGTWTLPETCTQPVLVQCKAGGGQRVGPQHVRELEGALAGAPPGWRRGLAVLACERPATKGVREALARSRWPMAFVCCEAVGKVRQMVWNKRAEEAGLEGVGVGTRFDKEGETEMVLLRKGRVLPFVSGGGCGEDERKG